jgi:muconate cycloisomerase
MIKVHSIIFRELNIPLNFQFSQSNNSGSNKSSSVVVELVSDAGLSGHGESCPRLYVTGESCATVKKDLSNIAPRLLNSEISDYDDFKQFVAEIKIGPSSLCAIELAWLDLWSKTTEKTLPKLLGVRLLDSLSYSLVLPLVSFKGLEKLVEKINFFKPASIKLKVDERATDHFEKVAMIRDIFGSSCPIRLDVNGGWSLDHAIQIIPKYLKTGISSFEQPLAPEEIKGLQKLTAEFGEMASIMVDESLLTLAQAQSMLEQKICNHFNLKISKLGGLARSHNIQNLAKDHNIPCQLGAHFGETSLLTSAGVLLASMGNALTAQEGALGTFLLQKDIVSNPIQQDHTGQLSTQQLFENPGLVDAIAYENMSRFTIDQSEWSTKR